MGKRIIQQRRGKGSFTYKAHSHRHKGETKYRVYDDKEREVVNGTVTNLIHCRGHSAPLAEISYDTGEVVLIPAPANIKLNENVSSGSKAEVKLGNVLPLKYIPEGTLISNIESMPGKISFCKSAGSFARVVAKSEDKVTIRLPSKKQKIIAANCRATIGVVAGSGKRDKPFVKAGKRHHAMRAKGKLYPRTSGVAMNAVDHPFGSGRGRHVGKSKIPPRHAPPGRNVGLLRPRRTGRKK